MSLLHFSFRNTSQAFRVTASHIFDPRSAALLPLLQPATSARLLPNVQRQLPVASISSMDQPRDTQPQTEPQNELLQQQPDCKACDGCDGAPELTPGLVPERGAAAGAAAPANPDCYACHDDKLPTAPPPGYSADDS